MEQPLDGVRIEQEKAYQVIHLLVEGMGIRAISRFTNLHQETVLNILAAAGEQCARLLDERIRNVQPEAVQVDELFCYVGCKERNNHSNDYYRGDQYLFLAMDAQSKLIISYIVGKRDIWNTQKLVDDLKGRVQSQFQITTDGFQPYRDCVRRTLRDQTDFAQLIKFYANPKDAEHGERRYSATQCIGTRAIVRHGKPDRSRISTSYIERANLTVRLFNRRFTRLTLGYSKTIEYLRHSTALFIAHYNFCRVHSTLKQTPAMAVGLENRVLTIKDLLKIDYSTI